MPSKSFVRIRTHCPRVNKSTERKRRGALNFSSTGTGSAVRIIWLRSAEESSIPKIYTNLMQNELRCWCPLNVKKSRPIMYSAKRSQERGPASSQTLTGWPHWFLLTCRMSRIKYSRSCNLVIGKLHGCHG